MKYRQNEQSLIILGLPLKELSVTQVREPLTKALPILITYSK